MQRAILKELSVEEFANTITHGFGLVLSIAGFAALVFLAALRGDPLLIAACIVYGLSLIVLYAASTIYHGTTSAELKHKLRLVDHCCIYLLIAGSYTPFGIILLNGTLGQAMVEMGFSRLNPSLGLALTRGTCLQPEVLDALGDWIRDNSR